jgi:hypothetical protein
VELCNDVPNLISLSKGFLAKRDRLRLRNLPTKFPGRLSPVTCLCFKCQRASLGRNDLVGRNSLLVREQVLILSRPIREIYLGNGRFPQRSMTFYDSYDFFHASKRAPLLKWHIGPYGAHLEII